MKKLIIIAMTAVSAMATAATQQNIIIKKAALNICPVSKTGRPLALGCRDSLQISRTKSVHFDLDSKASAEVEHCLNALIGSYRFHQFLKSRTFEVEGFITEETGRFPNPGAKFKVFHIVDSKNICSIPVPK